MTTIVGFALWVALFISVWGVLGLVSRVMCSGPTIRTPDEQRAPSEFGTG